MRGGRRLRRLKIVSPFVLLALGAWCLVSSPWPSIWRLMLRHQQVIVAYTWTTVGLPIAALVCFSGAIVISLGYKRSDVG